MMVFDSSTWTGRKAYEWVKNYFCFQGKYGGLALGIMWGVDAFGIECSFWPVKNPPEGGYRFKWNFTKPIVTHIKYKLSR